LDADSEDEDEDDAGSSEDDSEHDQLMEDGGAILVDEQPSVSGGFVFISDIF
jgi:hypothetical protein